MITSATTMDGLVLKQRQLAATAEGLRRDTFLSIEDVMEHLGVSRAVVEAYPMEILPFWDATPMSTRTRRRYNPGDVEALPTVIRRWTEARALGVGDDFLRERRELLREREERILSHAEGLRVP